MSLLTDNETSLKGDGEKVHRVVSFPADVDTQVRRAETSPRDDSIPDAEKGGAAFSEEDPVDERARLKALGIDSGYAAWMVVLGAWCVSFCTYGWINSESQSSPSWRAAIYTVANTALASEFSSSIMKKGLFTTILPAQ